MKSKNSERCARYRERHPERAKESTRRYMVKMRAWLDAAKALPCVDCDTTYPPECMDFDHVRGEKVRDVSQMYNRVSLATLQEEIAKCDLVCANCHRVRTFRRLRGAG